VVDLEQIREGSADFLCVEAAAWSVKVATSIVYRSSCERRDAKLTRRGHGCSL
jgi:hypothetical protein